MTLEVRAMRGFPSSGKSTLASQWVAADPESRSRLSRDDLRAGLFAVEGVGSQPQEQIISRVIKGQAETLLKAGVSIVIDNTNLRIRDLKEWQALAHKFGASFSVVDVKTSADECVLRDSIRKAEGGRGVGEAVIRNFAKRFPISSWQDIPPVALPVPGRQYFPNPDLPKTLTVDIDGSIADMTGIRGPFETDLYAFDKEHPEIVELVRIYKMAKFAIVFLSGRSEDFYDVTWSWLVDKIGFQPDALVMRKSGDLRNDAIIKPELFWEQVADKYSVRLHIDDRQRVVDAIRDLGIPVLQCRPGQF